MAINVSIYSNGNASSKSVSIDFVKNVLAASNSSGSDGTNEYYFKLSSGAADTDGKRLPIKLIKKLDDLALNSGTGNKQSATNTDAAYTDIRSMVIDYIFDYVNGHTANQFSSGVTVQKPMQF